MRPVTLPVTLNLLVTQSRTIVVTFAAATVPASFVNVQSWLGTPGCVLMVPAYAAPATSGVEKANLPFAVTLRSLPALF